MQAQLNQVCKKHNSHYSAMYVSWNDNARNQGSAVGPNITDARLKGKDGEDFLVVRPQNFDEKIGKVKASDVAVLVGNHNDSELTPVTLDTYLNRFGEYAGYAGASSSSSLAAADRDLQVGIRFQAVFLPTNKSATNESAKEFFPETYNYQTRSKDDPKNVVLLCTSQGTFVQQDGPSYQAQYLHKKDPFGSWNNHYLEALETRHGVSMGQQETAQEREQALKQGKAVSTVIGIRSMGTGFNRLMTIQIPLRQRVAPPTYHAFGDMIGEMNLFSAAPPSASFSCFDQMACPPMSMQQSQMAMSFSPNANLSLAMGASMRSSAPAPVSRAHAARVSYGSRQGPMQGLKASQLNRDSDCSITITVQFYFVVTANTAIHEQDIKSAIDVCEEAYKGCSWQGSLMSSDPNSQFAKSSQQPFPAPFTPITPYPCIPSPGPMATVFPSPTPTPTPVAPAIPVSATTPCVIASPPAASFLSPTYGPLMGLPVHIQDMCKSLPLSQEAFLWFHDSVGLELLNSRSDLAASFHGFRLANDIHTNLYGTPSPTALYNMACVLSLVGEEQIKLFRNYFPYASFQSLAQITASPGSTGGIVAPNLPPNLTNTVNVGQVVQQRLNQSLTFLRLAVSSGYTQYSHMSTDTDLNCLKHFEPQGFARVVDAAKTAAALTQK